MSDLPEVESYLARLGACLRGGGRRRGDILDELREHLREALEAAGQDPQAARAVTARLGEPEDLAGEFNRAWRASALRRLRAVTLLALAVTVVFAVNTWSNRAGPPGNLPAGAAIDWVGAALRATPTLRAALARLGEDYVQPEDTGLTAGNIGETRVLHKFGSGPYAGVNVYVSPAEGGGSCLTVLNAMSCSARPPDAATPVHALGIGETAGRPFLLVGVRLAGVAKHVVRCAGVGFPVEAIGGAGAFVLVAPDPGVSLDSCRHELVLDDGIRVEQ